MIKVTMFCALLAAVIGASASWAQTTLSSTLPAAISRNVFEVVVAKPTFDPLTYEKPLPLDLLPFSERTDTQYSIGTAFAIGGGRFVSAAHVFALDTRTLSGPIALRDAQGVIHPVGKILAYSNRRDYAVFEVPGLAAEGLPLSTQYVLNGTVYSAGNAYGEGIVIRDGVLTSMTPEERSGEWKWLRFSAAASPGNSGGPLVDASGQVIGVVTMMSENGDLNYALPTSEIDMRPVAILDVQDRYKLPNLLQDAPVQGVQTFPLPLGVDELRRQMSAALTRMALAAGTTITEGDSAHLFPNASGSAPALDDTEFTLFPKMIGENPDRTWSVQGVSKPSYSRIGNDGSLEWGDMWGYTFFSLIKAKGIATADLFHDPRKLMDTVLEGYPVNRTIASERVRITSYGNPALVESFADSYGRRWLYARWDVPWANISESLLALPTPLGAVGFVGQGPYSEWEAYRFDMRFLANFLFVSYEGSFSDWRDFLAAADLRPALFDTIRFDFSPAGSVRLDTPRIDLTYTSSLIGISDSSWLAVLPAYYRSGGRVVWDNARVFLTESRSGKSYISVDKTFQPTSDASSRVERTWTALTNDTYPYNDTPFREGGTTSVYATVHPGINGKEIVDPTFVYGLRMTLDGNLNDFDAQSKFNLFKNGFRLKSTEAESAASTPAQAATASELATIDGKTIFQAISTNDAGAVGKFIDAKRDLDAHNDDARTPLMLALRLGELSIVKRLLDAGASVNLADRFSNTPLILALRYADYATVEALLNRGADPNVHDANDVTPLMLAMATKFNDIPQQLLGRGVDVNAISTYKRSALLDALIAGRDDIADDLIRRGVKLDLVDNDGWTMLMAALRYCSSDTAQLLIDHGAPVGGKNASGWTPIDFALNYGHGDIALELARSLSGDVNSKNTDGWTALMFAARYGTPDIMHALLARGAETNMQNRDGWTALMIAVVYDKAANVDVLLTNGASESQRTNLGENALQMAIVKQETSIALELVKRASIDDVNVADKDGVNALTIAARWGTPAVIEALIAKGADMHYETPDGWTPLMDALRYGTQVNAWTIIQHLDSAPERDKEGWTALHFAARYMPAYLPDLVRLGSSVNDATKAGWTPLEFAAYNGDLASAKWLVSHGADLTHRNENGNTALDVARNEKKLDVASYLETAMQSQ